MTKFFLPSVACLLILGVLPGESGWSQDPASPRDPEAKKAPASAGTAEATTATKAEVPKNPLPTSKSLSAPVASDMSQASKSKPWANSLGMRFVPITLENGRKVLMGQWETRLVDFRAYATEAKLAVDTSVFVLTPSSWKNSTGASWEKIGHPQSDFHPVVGVSFLQAKAFCAWLSRKEGRTYRLPTDHEWSCAVGIGEKEDASQSPAAKTNRITDVFPWGAAWPPPLDSANLAGTESKAGAPSDWRSIPNWQDPHPRTSGVGLTQPNALGLFDMAGNAFEWCDSGFTGPQDLNRTVRGGSWATPEKLFLYSSYRAKADPTLAVEQYGFRVVVVP